ncbi:MAG TPA: flagellar hook-length control protein FliK [Pseudolabrys sp.]|nr:flagellar hook-length control protein FliK [Pseudolabrys sp.]
MPQAASELMSHAAPAARSRTPPHAGTGQQASGGSFENLLDCTPTPASEQTVPVTGRTPQQGDKSAAAPPAKQGQAGAASGDAAQPEQAVPGVEAPDPGKVVGNGQTADTSAGVISDDTGKTVKSDKTENPRPPDRDRADNEDGTPPQDDGKAGVQPVGGSPMAAVVASAVASAVATPAQAGTPRAPEANPTDAAAGDAIKSALTPLSVLQTTHGPTAGSQTAGGKHQSPSNSAAVPRADATAPSAGIRTVETDGNAADDQAGNRKSIDAKASAPEHAEARDALHRLMSADASDTNNNNDSHAAAAKTLVQASTPLPTTTPAPQSASLPSPAPVQQAGPPAPLPVPVPLAGVPIAIAGKALAGKNHFEIRLDPPELGRIDVRLDVDKDGRITSHVIADRKDTLNLLQRDASGLQRALQDAGLKTADSGLQFSLRDQWSNGNAGQHSSGGHRRTEVIFPEETAPVSATAPRVYARFFSRAGGIDIRV